MNASYVVETLTTTKGDKFLYVYHKPSGWTSEALPADSLCLWAHTRNRVTRILAYKPSGVVCPDFNLADDYLHVFVPQGTNRVLHLI